MSRWIVTVVLTAALSGCLGTRVNTPRTPGETFTSTHPHLIGSWYRVDAGACTKGIATAETWVPIWGIAVGILTFGILIPFTTSYACVAGGGTR